MSIEELRQRVLQREAEAKAAEPTNEEKDIAALVEREREATEALAAADALRRSNDLALRLAAAETAAAGRYLVAGIDLVKLFPLGRAPDSKKLPGRGVIIVREPEPAAYNRFTREVEAKQKDHGPLFADLLCGCLIDPDPESPEGDRLVEFSARYPGAAIGAGDTVAKLGGARTQADKRGRT